MHSDYAANFYAHLIVSQLTPGMLKVFFSRYTRSVVLDHEIRGTTRGELIGLDKAIEKIQPRCIRTHEQSGLKFLLNKAFTPKGGIRRTDHGREFKANDQLFLQSVARHGEYAIHLVGTTLVGWDRPHSCLTGVYRLTTLAPERTSGGLLSLTYESTSWQSGGHFCIRETERKQ